MKFRNLLVVFFATFSFSFFGAAAVSANNDPLAELCAKTPSATVCTNRNQQPSDNAIYGPNGIITRITGILAIVTGIAAVIVIIIAGLQYVLSTGDPAKINKAKDMILYALAGLVIAALAQSIVVFVLSEL